MSIKKKRNSLTRREFNSKLTKAGAGLATASVFPSFNKKGNSFEGNFIDMHHHLGADLTTASEHFTFDPIIKWMDQNKVSQSVILSPIQYPEKYYTRRGEGIIHNDELLERFQETNGRLLPFCLVHQDAFNSQKEIVKVLKRFKKKGVIGFGELKPRDASGNASNMALDDPAMQRIYAACAEVNFPVLIHIDNRYAVDQPGLPALEKMLKKYHDVNFIGHANGWWNSISGDVKVFKGYPKGEVTPGGAAVRLLEKYPNIYGDLAANSGLNAITRDLEHGLKFLNDFSDKLLFGTDALGGKGREAHFNFFNNADIPKEVKKKILQGNTRKLLNL